MNTVSVTQLRSDTATILSDISNGQNISIIMQRSRPTAVLVDYDYYQALEEAALDLSDSREAEKAKKEKRDTVDSYIEKRFGKTPA